MTDSLAQPFIDALLQLERTHNLEPMAELFADDAEIGNVIAPEKFRGPEGARDFWKKYRDTFQTIQSSFRNQLSQDGLISLEWTTQGTAASGSQLSYEGVSILEIADGKIKRFRAYFDSGSLGRQLEAPDMKIASA